MDNQPAIQSQSASDVKTQFSAVEEDFIRHWDGTLFSGLPRPEWLESIGYRFNPESLLNETRHKTSDG